MTREEVNEIYGNDADTLCQHICVGCTSNDWYCPKYCDVCKWVQRNYDLAIERLAKWTEICMNFAKKAKTWKRR